jgi:predicted ribosome quality control (RQC) complex YloA/Tae2 family protein
MKLIVKYIDSIKQNIEYYVGENAQDNFDIIDASEPDDIWFHMSNISSCHVVAKMPLNNKLNRKQIHKIIVQGAQLCKQHSRLKSQKDVQITYTKIRNVNKTDIVGSVMLVDFNTIII